MKQLHSFHDLHISKQVNIAHVHHIFRESFSEMEIIALNDLLLTNGFHTITVKNRTVGRRIIETFLSLLNYYSQIAWLSIDQAPPVDMVNLAKLLQEKTYLAYPCVDKFIAFLSEDFFANMLIIECSDNLLHSNWYAKFEQASYETGLYETMPLVHIMYQNSC